MLVVKTLLWGERITTLRYSCRLNKLVGKKDGNFEIFVLFKQTWKRRDRNFGIFCHLNKFVVRKDRNFEICLSVKQTCGKEG